MERWITTIVTRYESFRSLNAACEPIYPAPPVTKTWVTPGSWWENWEQKKNQKYDGIVSKLKKRLIEEGGERTKIEASRYVEKYQWK